MNRSCQKKSVQLALIFSSSLHSSYYSSLVNFVRFIRLMFYSSGSYRSPTRPHPRLLYPSRTFQSSTFHSHTNEYSKRLFLQMFFFSSFTRIFIGKKCSFFPRKIVLLPRNLSSIVCSLIVVRHQVR